MVKVIDRSEINTELRLYHKFIEKWVTRQVIRKFNKECKKAIQSGEKELRAEKVIPGYLFEGSGLRAMAKESGAEKAFDEISKTYPFEYIINHFTDSYYVFHLEPIKEEQ